MLEVRGHSSGPLCTLVPLDPSNVGPCHTRSRRQSSRVPSTCCFTSFCAIAESLGAHFKDISFPFRYGGNVRVMLQAGRSENPAIDAQVQEIQRIETAFDQKFQVLNKSIGEWKARMSDKIRGLVKSYGPLPAKAFPGRAAILAKLLE